MQIEGCFVWKCDLCTKTGKAEHSTYPPKDWRVFSLYERVKDEVYVHDNKHLVNFSICKECNERRYKDMHPVRRALVCVGILKDE
jgi:hypothetical protein